MQELARVVKPGGKIFILLWSSQMLLPGYPLLEARLNVTALGQAPFDTNLRPEFHSMRGLGWFQQAGLSEAKARTFIRDINPPLNYALREALVDLFIMRWGEDNPELSKEERFDYLRLCREDSPDFILNIPGYYAFFTYSLFWGQKMVGDK
jgi:demethylmenaquinone methyltransferase/2-methoxy-6-polyprenyl-1,4-benzoquinol methylase